MLHNIAINYIICYNIARCDFLNAIKNGDQKWGENGEFLYDGTDLEDQYIDLKGEVCYPPWSASSATEDEEEDNEQNKLEEGEKLQTLRMAELKFNMLYHALRSIVLLNKNVPFNRIITAFDQSLKQLAQKTQKNLRYESASEIERLMFINVDKLFSSDIRLNTCIDYYTSNMSILNNIGKIIDAASKRCYIEFSQTFVVDATELYFGEAENAIVGENNFDMFMLTSLNYGATNIRLYFQLMASLMLRIVYQDRLEGVSNIEAFLENIPYHIFEFILSKFCRYNYIRWLADYLDDKELYFARKKLERFATSEKFLRRMHKFANGKFY